MAAEQPPGFVLVRLLPAQAPQAPQALEAPEAQKAL
jgi:hypothetical protein